MNERLSFERELQDLGLREIADSQFEAAVRRSLARKSSRDMLPSAKPRVLTYSPNDVIDDRISVPAQHSLVRLSKKKATSSNAVGMLEEVKAGRLAGIFCVNWEKSAQRALRLGKSWWTVIPKGEDAILMLDPDNLQFGPPMISFRRELDPDCGLLKGEKKFASSTSRIDAALIKVWPTYVRFRQGEFSPCSSEAREESSTNAGNPLQNNLGQLSSGQLRPPTNVVPPCCPNTCPTQNLCHVNSRRSGLVGKSFRRGFLDLHKPSSVCIIFNGALDSANQNTITIKYFGSGTIIGPNLVLTSAHVIQYFRANYYKTFTEKDLRVALNYEYTAQTVDTPDPKLPNNVDVQMVESCVEEGSPDTEDYAILRLMGVNNMSRVEKILNKILSVNEEVIAFQHPMPTSKESATHPLHVTRVSAGPVQAVNLGGGSNACANFLGRAGSSGGGVFNKDGCLIGVIKGDPGSGGCPRNGMGWFVQMSDIVKRSSILKKWIKQDEINCVKITDLL